MLRPHWRSLDRKLWILPLLALATAVAVLLPTEMVMRARYPGQETDSCIVEHVAVPYARANCTSFVKVAEGPWVENRYNECGYRSPDSCGALPPGALRIAIIGSSLGAGYFVSGPESVSGRIATDLSRACRRPVQSQNLALPDFPVTDLAASARKALALRPTVLLITVSSYDLGKPVDRGPKKAASLMTVIRNELQRPFELSTTAYMAKQTYLSSERNYTSFVAAQQRSSSYVAGQTLGGLSVLTGQLDEILKLDRHLQIPIALSYIPLRDEVTRERVWQGYHDPAAASLRQIAKERAMRFVDILGSIPKSVPTVSLYYVANHHLNGTGDRYVAQAVMRDLTQSVPAFAGCQPV